MVTTTRYIYDGNQYLAEADETDTITRLYTNEPDAFTHLISQEEVSTGETLTYHYDAIGSTRKVTDNTETVTDEFTYDAWGNRLSRTGTKDIPFQYVGQYGYYRGDATESYYVMARTYQPSMARWTSMDPHQFIDGLNLYQYVHNNPCRYYDPTGFKLTDKEKEKLSDCGCKAFKSDMRGARGWVECKNGKMSPVANLPNNNKPNRDPRRTNEFNKLMNKCGILDCIEEEEKRHIEQFTEICGNPCENCPDGLVVAMELRCQKPAECYGGAAMLGCLVGTACSWSRFAGNGFPDGQDESSKCYRLARIMIIEKLLLRKQHCDQETSRDSRISEWHPVFLDQILKGKRCKLE